VLAKLIELGNLGQKTKAGFYKKVGRDILRELDSEDYVPAGQKADEVYGRMLKKPAAERLKLLRNAEGRRPVPVGHSAQQLPLRRRAPGPIADTARDVDQAMRWGFGMKQGPFELWQEAGWLQVAKMVQEDIDAGKALCKAPLPEWVFKGPVAEAGGVHTPQGSWSPAPSSCRAASCRCTSASTSPRAAGRGRPAQTAGTTLFEDEACACGRWTARC
jgi:3-hydroxyacyl-CoA dehydrogenase